MFNGKIKELYLNLEVHYSDEELLRMQLMEENYAK